MSRHDREGPSDPARREALKRLLALGALAAVGPGALSLSGCGRRPSALHPERKVVVLGLDGLDAQLMERWMAEGKLPHFSRLRQAGGYGRLASTSPPQSPVAWATIATGLGPDGHGIFDFIQRDPRTYFPYLSIARTEEAKRTVSVGEWRVPLSGARVTRLRRGRTFWEVLASEGVPCSVYRLPTQFPVGGSGANELAGLGAPDLRGTYGEFSYYTDAPPANARSITGGAVYRVTVSNGHVRARLFGPDNSLLEDEPQTSAEFDIWMDADHRLAKIAVQGQEVLLRQGEWSDWVPVRFELVPHLKSAAGICRFYLKQAGPYLGLYVTPINVDPADPALPIAAPSAFSRDLVARFGRFYTMGFPEDVKALRHDILDEDEYLHQTGIAVDEARRMHEHALHAFERGLLFSYFSFTDRTQHMFWRAMDDRHPLYTARLGRDYGPVIERTYQEADALVGRTLEAIDGDTTLLVLSDHGFNPYYRSFDLNAWLAKNGYLAGRDAWGEGADLFGNTDWSRTAAYALGFNGVYLNLRGREAEGVVGPEERDGLLDRVTKELRQARDPQTGEPIVASVHRPRSKLTDHAPDLIVGYARGYRCSDESVLGEVQAGLVQDNLDKWSGDHCVDRALVNGVAFANKRVAEGASLLDVAPSLLAEFGVAPPEEMAGRTLWKG
jgi:predicted AlkP superfamily phosphohydrolase/phosphomutase